MKRSLTLLVMLCVSSFSLCYESTAKKQVTPLFTNNVTVDQDLESVEFVKNELYIKQVADKIDLNLSRKIIIYAKKYDIPLDVAFTLVATESDFNVNAISKAGAASGRGLLQVSDIALLEFNNWHSAAEFVQKQELLTASKNLDVGFWYLSFIKSKLKIDTWSYIYMAYNVGMRDFKLQKDLLLNRQYRTHSGKIVAYNALTRFNSMYSKYKFNSVEVALK